MAAPLQFCSHYPCGVQCRSRADVQMYAPDGEPVPGVSCSACAERCIAEYREKLGEVWTLKPLEPTP